MKNKKFLVRDKNLMLIGEIELKKAASDRYRVASYAERQKILAKMRREINQTFAEEVKISEVLNS